MKSIPEIKSQLPKKLGWAGIGLCSLCCALPIIAAIAGIGSLTVVALYLEKFAMLVLAIAAAAFAYSFFRRKPAAIGCQTTCKTDSSCKTIAESQL